MADAKSKTVVTNVLSFGVLDDCQFMEGYPEQYTFTNVDELEAILDNIDIPTWLHIDLELDVVARSLDQNKYYVINRVEKYYVVAFAINYTQFEIFSKDVDKQLIDWEISENDKKKWNPIVIHQIDDDDDYNENPVVTLLRELEDVEESSDESEQVDDDGKENNQK